MSLSKEEKTIQKKLSVLSGACLLGALIFPPLALVSGAVLVGQAGRAYRTKDSGNDEIPETEPIRNVSPNRRYEENSFIPESPETAIARRSPEIGKRALEEISRNVMYAEIAKRSEGAAKEYLDNMRELNPDRIANSNGIKISFNQKENQGLRKILFGEENIGYQIKINLLNENDK